MRLYIQSKTKASYQGTTDLKERVRDLLGIPKASIPDARIKALDGFFTARNDIAHRLDYVTPQGPSTKRHHRSPADVVKECDRVLIVTSSLIHATAAELNGKFRCTWFSPFGLAPGARASAADDPRSSAAC